MKFFILIGCFPTVFLFLIHSNPNPSSYPLTAQNNVSKTLIAVEMGDSRRLGNFMFNYASLLGIATRNHMDRVLPSGFSLKDIFHISGRFADDIDSVMKSHRTYEEHDRRACAYDPGTEKLNNVTTKLLGYYQSWRYFQNVTEQLRREFTFRKEVLDVAEKFHESIHIQEWNDRREPGSKSQKYIKVGIHVRRGDFLYPVYRKMGHTVPGKEYFQKAMAYFTERYDAVQFVVCSDAIRWVTENLVLPKNSTSRVAFSEGHKDYEDLAILALCDHTIMSVGSFGWWAGWLAGGTTFYYKNWPKENTTMAQKVDKKTYFPPEWVALA